jgi:hypothetical protein
MNGAQIKQQMLQNGFSDQEATQWEADVRSQMAQNGFSIDESDKYFGVPKPDMKPMQDYFAGNIEKWRKEQGMKEDVAGPPKAPPKPAESMLEALQAGWQMSVSGLMKNGKAPDVLLPEHAPMYARLASQIGTLAGDAPFMIAGALGGGALGSEFPIVGNVIGAGAGSFALPAAIRETLMQHYEKGDIKDFADFYTRSSAILWETVKNAAVGGATAGVGGVAAKGLAAAAPVARVAGSTAAELTTMVTVGHALEGEVPKASDFMDAALIIGGMHGAFHVAGKLRTIYAQTGMKPQEVLGLAKSDPGVRQEILSSNIDVPQGLPKDPGAKSEPLKPIEAPGDLTVKSNVLNDATPPNGVAFQGEPEIKFSKFDKFYTDFLDDLHPVKQLVDILRDGKILETKDDPYKVMRLQRGSYGKAEVMLEHGPFKFDTLEDTGTRGLKKILEPIKDDPEAFSEYAKAARAEELHARGIETGLDPEETARIVKEGKSKYEKPFREAVQFQNDVLGYLKDSGIVSKEGYEQMLEANKNYVPFYRLAAEGEENIRGSGGKGFSVRNPVKGIKGSTKEIANPIESIIKNTYLYITLAERNRGLSELVKLSEKTDTGRELLQKVPTPLKPIEVSDKEVAKFLKDHGLDPDAAEAFTIFRPKFQQLAKDEIAVYRDGKREIYKVAPEVAEVVQNLDSQSAHWALKVAAIPAKMLRAGAVLTPDFMARNLVRDMTSAFNLAEGVFTPLNSLIGLKAIFSHSKVGEKLGMKPDEAYVNWLKSGGANSAMVSIDREYIQQNIFKLSKETGLIDSAINVVKSPLEMLRVLSEVIENSTRLGEFKRVTNGDSSAMASFKGGYSSREVTLDFQRAGAKGRAINAITAFWNAQVQGVDKAARTIKERPVETTLKLAASITLPSMLLWYANHDDPRYKEIPRWQKDLFWIVMTDDHVYRIPKPHELGVIFGSLPERVLEAYIGENPRAMKDFQESMGQAFTPSFVPTFMIPVAEVWANKSIFTGSPIVPKGIENLEYDTQYTSYTSEAAKLFGTMLGGVPMFKETRAQSPVIIEELISAWSGNMGKYVLQVLDQALVKSGAVPDPVKPAKDISEMAFFRAFMIKNPSAQAQSIADFFSRIDPYERRFNTIQHLAKQGDTGRLEDKLNDPDTMDRLTRLNGMSRSLSNLNRAVQTISQMKSGITPEEKRQQIELAYKAMIDIAQAGNQIMDEQEKKKK